MGKMNNWKDLVLPPTLFAKMAPPERGQVVGGRYPFTGAAMVTESVAAGKLRRVAYAQPTRAVGYQSAIMHGQPNGRMPDIGPSHAVAAVRRDEEIIARPQDARLHLTLEQKTGRPGEKQHPFGPVLVVPGLGRARLPGGNDALDAQIVSGEECNYLLGVETFG